jgi:membrane-associated phospholipid phosphatase
MADSASPGMEKVARALTLAADERLLFAAAATVWVATRFSASPRRRQAADHVAINVVVTAILPHILKNLFTQERPDRCMVHGPRNGIPISGEAGDAFPSGHAMHVGAVASALSRYFPAVRALIWGIGGVLAATRVVVLAHWVTDVLVGLAAGLAIEKVLWRFCPAKWNNQRK